MPPTPVDRDTFVVFLRKSRLLSTRQYREVLDSLAHFDTAKALAKDLRARGLLTRFQAKMLLTGHTRGFFLGPYRVLDQLGQGGMGRVYKARHEAMDRTVALKVLSPNLVKTARARQLFRSEVKAAARLTHPNIVTAYDANQIGSRHYLAMEYIAGPNLEQLVRQHGPLPVGLACEIVRQVAVGLQHAHEQGMVHRDIKPANVVVSSVTARDEPPSRKRADADFVVKILDFGLAGLQLPRGEQPENPIAKKRVSGTVDYMSPEQATDLETVDIRGDLYSLGCTLYFLLTAKVPFQGGSAVDKLLRHHNEPPMAVEHHRKEVPTAVGDIVLKLLAKDPADRYQTPLALAEALAAHAADHAFPLTRGGPAVSRNGIEDTAPAAVVTQLSAETEAITSWVQEEVASQRYERVRKMLVASGILAAVGAAALLVTAAVLAWCFFW